jgi:hypothetical protein
MAGGFTRLVLSTIRVLHMNEEADAFLILEKGLIDGYDRYAVIPLRTDMMTIGRQHKNRVSDADIPDLRVRDDYVSRGHINIYFSYDYGCFIMKERDGGTTNGTFINGERIKPSVPHPLKDGDLIFLARIGGDYRVAFRFRESDNTLAGYLGRKRPLAGGLELDLRARRVWVEGKETPLRRKEFDLLAFLFQNRGKVCSKDEIAQEVWKQENGIVSQETIEQNISRIRKVIEHDSAQPQYIKTVHGGYRLDL